MTVIQLLLEQALQFAGHFIVRNKRPTIAVNDDADSNAARIARVIQCYIERHYRGVFTSRGCSDRHLFTITCPNFSLSKIAGWFRPITWAL